MRRMKMREQERDELGFITTHYVIMNHSCNDDINPGGWGAHGLITSYQSHLLIPSQEQLNFNVSFGRNIQTVAYGPWSSKTHVLFTYEIHSFHLNNAKSLNTFQHNSEIQNPVS